MNFSRAEGHSRCEITLRAKNIFVRAKAFFPSENSRAPQGADFTSLFASFYCFRRRRCTRVRTRAFSKKKEKTAEIFPRKFSEKNRSAIQKAYYMQIFVCFFTRNSDQEQTSLHALRSNKRYRLQRLLRSFAH